MHPYDLFCFVFEIYYTFYKVLIKGFVTFKNVSLWHVVIYKALEINIWLNVNSMLLLDIISDLITAMIDLNSDQLLCFNYKQKD